MHLGASANAGHYIAHIRDETTNRWWKFNDSNVTSMDFKEVGEPEPGYYDREDEILQYYRQRNQPAHKQIFSAASVAAEKLKKPKISSKDAYMLIYTKRMRNMLDNVDPPLPVSNIVDQQNAQLNNIVCFLFIYFILFIYLFVYLFLFLFYLFVYLLIICFYFYFYFK